MLRWLKIKVLRTVVNVANYGLTHYADGADDQNEINEVVATKNWALRELEKLGATP